MRLRALLSFVLLSAAPGMACDSGEDPKPVSTFAEQEPLTRQIVGRVRQGTEPVEGALVQVDTSPPFLTSTDAVGGYRAPYAPMQYDLSVRRDREVFVFRGLAVRIFEPPLGADAPIRAFHARVVATTDPPPKPGNAIAFVVGGPDAVAITGDAGSLDATFRRFDTTITLYAIEYVARDGVVNAVAEGRTSIRVRDGSGTSTTVPMTPITAKLEVVFEAKPPEGYALAPLEVLLDLGVRTSSLVLTRLEPGVPFQLPVVPDGRYSVHGRATLGAAISDSGRQLINAYDHTIAVVLPQPVSAEAPIDDDAPPAAPASDALAPVYLDPGGALTARIASGAIEHVFAPVSGDGVVIRVATSARTTTLPDVTRLGLPAAVGRYTWTMEHFPKLPRVDNLSGADGRVSPASWKSPPRVVVLR